MKDTFVVTIGRHFGSGGREIGEKVAKRLDIPFYDDELVTLAAKENNLFEQSLADVDERANTSLLYSMVMNAGLKGLASPTRYEMPINDRLFIAQSEVIKNLAKKGSCVIVGRCADYILENEDVNTIKVFLYADETYKTNRIMNLYNLSEKEAKAKIQKCEKQRKSYYNYYSNKEWGKMTNYDLCINVSLVGIDTAVCMISDLVKQFNP